MPIYTNKKRFSKIVSAAYNKAFQDAEVRAKLADEKAILGVHLKDIDLWWHIIIDNGNLKWVKGKPETPDANVTFQKAEIFHKVFSGKRNLFLYIFTRKVKVEGNRVIGRKFGILHKPLMKAYQDEFF
jgi:alkyl sulfatase BDS1-like metallo-beta-lactamase superfamily hydrolase